MNNLPNRNPETGIRYGYISANSLNPDVVTELEMEGRDVRWEDARQELANGIRGLCEGYMSKYDTDSIVDAAMSAMSGDNWYDDEPIHEGTTFDGVKYSTSWLGGALNVWVFESPVTGTFQECSPCVPGAGNLDCPDPDGVLTYDVPSDWRRDEE